MLTRTSPIAAFAFLLMACTAPAPMITDDGGLTDGGGNGAACGACSADQVCDNGTCRDLPSSCPCPKMSFCDIAANTCKAGCLDDAQCNAGQYCDAGTRKCQAGCNKDTMCTGSDICADHGCRPGCRRDSACPGSTCDLATLSCECTVVDQLYCAMDKKCTTHDGKEPVCDMKGAKTRGQACTGSAGVDDCAAGLYCRADGMLGSQCRRFCDSDMDCGAGSFCDLPLAIGASLSLCTQPCNAQSGMGCAAGLACHVAGEEHTNCEAPGMSAAGGACTTSANCAAGLTCIDSVIGAKCRKVCNKGDTPSCGVGFACRDISSESYDWKTYGACCPNAGGC